MCARVLGHEMRPFVLRSYVVWSAETCAGADSEGSTGRCGIEEPSDTVMTSAWQCKEVGQSCSYVNIRSHSFSTCVLDDRFLWYSGLSCSVPFHRHFSLFLQSQAVYAAFTPTYWTVQMIILSAPNVWGQITLLASRNAHSDIDYLLGLSNIAVHFGLRKLFYFIRGALALTMANKL